MQGLAIEVLRPEWVHDPFLNADKRRPHPLILSDQIGLEVS